MLDPEEMTFMEWFGICFVIVLIVFFACRWIDISMTECIH